MVIFLIALFKKFPTEESCIEYLEKVRFAKVIIVCIVVVKKFISIIQRIE